jgi:DNA-binding NarL/FixJ family response regulator
LRPYAGLRLSQHLVAARERAEAKQVLATAAEDAAALGSALLADRIAALAQRAGLVVAAPVEKSPVAGLTPRELEVLQLVAAGRSNGEIGTALFISTKTASVHVSNILAKLGVSGRGEAAALAHRVGLTIP